MGNSQSSIKLNYEDIQFIIKNPDGKLLINIMPENMQDCLILKTLNSKKEEEVMNSLLRMGNKKIKIVIYGKNANDDKIYEKYQQLVSLGFYNVFVYPGGLFEWLLLQDIYGSEDFPTTKKELDILKYKPNQVLNIPLLEY